MRAWHACAAVADSDIGWYAYFIHSMHFLLGGFYECRGFVLSVTVALGVNEPLPCTISLRCMLGKRLYSIPLCGG